MPSEVKKEMRVKFLNNYQIGIYYYIQSEASLLINAQQIQNKLLQYGLIESKSCSSSSIGVCSPMSKEAEWFQGRLEGNTIRYDQSTEYEIASVLRQVLSEVYPQNEFRLERVETPTPNYISIFLN